jgi:hypothetical protein
LYDKTMSALIQCPMGKAGNVAIPASVTRIGTYAFFDCANLSGVTVPDSVTSIGSYAFYNCASLSSITIPNSVTSIGSYAFWYCTSLRSLTLPNSVTSIEDGLFYNCSNLASVTIPAGVTRIGSYAFYYCGSLGSVTLPPGITDIGSHAFDGCGSLTSVTVPASVDHIGSYAFYDCDGLARVNFNGNAPSIGSSVFSGSNPASVYYLAWTTGWGTTFGTRPTVWWIVPPVAPEEQVAPRIAISGGTVSLTVEPTLAGRRYQLQSSATLAGGSWQVLGPLWIGDGNKLVITAPYDPAVLRRFYRLALVPPPGPPLVTSGIASGITAAAATLQGTVNPNGLASTARFEYGLTDAYGNTTEVTLSPNIGSAEQAVSASLGGLQAGTTYHYRLTASNVSGTSPGADLTFTTYLPVPYTYTSAGGTVTITGATNSGSALSIPGTINGLPVTGIGPNAFTNNSSLTSVYFNSNITRIEDSAFLGCGGLSRLYFIGNAPSLGADVFLGADQASVYHMAGTTGWGATFGGRPTVLWVVPPIAPAELLAPQINVSGSTVSLSIRPSVAGRRYQVQSSPTLADGAWQEPGPVWVGDGNSLDITTPRDPAVPRRFHRLVLDGALTP